MDENDRPVKPLRLPGVLIGAAVGAMLTAALIAIFYALGRSAGLPFVPFDVFDWMTRVLPGPVIGFGIHTMVSIIRALDVGPTSVVAKAAEQAMGIAGLFVTGIVGGAILFGILRALRGRYAYLLGLDLGLAVGIPVMLISLYQGRTASVAPSLSAGWILAYLCLLGPCLSPGSTTAARSDAPAGRNVSSAATVSSNGSSRRQFLDPAWRCHGCQLPWPEPWSGRCRQAPAAESGYSSRSAAMVRHSRPAECRRRRHTGAGTRPEYTPLEQHYRIDINTIPPTIDAISGA